MEIVFKVEKKDDLDEIFKLINGESIDCQNVINKEISSYVSKMCKLLDVTKIHRIMYGSEFCQFRMPSESNIKEMIKICEEKNVSFTLQTPHVDEYGMDKMKKLLDALTSYEIEIEVNDLGVLNYISKCEHKWTLVAGRMWDQSFHDGRLSAKEQIIYYGQSNEGFMPTTPLDSDGYKLIFNKYSLNIINIDATVTKNEGMQGYGLYFPYVYMTTGGICKMRCLSQDMNAKFSIDKNTCEMKCMKYDETMNKSFVDMSDNNAEFKEGYTLRRVKMYKKGNTVFYIPCSIVEDVEKYSENVKNFERIVFETKLML